EMTHHDGTMSYRVREPFLAIRDDPPHQFTFVTLLPGSIIAVKGEPQRSGLVDVLHEGNILGAFMRDILSRCERVQAHGQ
ncbi:MAG TPA: hypothetical protein VGV35_11585, partial [Bryobacteraceae bacterium]|nr:hypothetical protein [Bryobacteraceae bacterium]